MSKSERMQQRIVDEFDKVCKRKRLKASVGENKVSVLEGVVFLCILLFLVFW